MRIFRLLVFVLSIVFGLTSYQPKVRAAEYYDNTQLNYIFSGSNFNISGLYCKSSAAVNMYDAEMDIIFKTDHTFAAEAVCFSRAQWNEKSSGNWKVENGSVCLNFRGQELINNVFSGTPQICRQAKQGRFSIELFA